MKTNKKVAGCFLAVFMLLAVSVASASAYTTGIGNTINGSGDWIQTEVVSSESDGGSDGPSINVDSLGRAHVAWGEPSYSIFENPTYEVSYKYRTSDGSWTDAEIISGDAWDDCWLYIDLAVDSSNKVHVVWQSDSNYGNSGNDMDIFYRCRSSGGNWGPIEVVSQNNGASHVPTVAVDSSGVVHVAWHDDTWYLGSGVDVDIFYRYKSGGSWSSTQVISTGSVLGSWYPDLAIDSSDGVHIVWYDESYWTSSGVDYDIFYRDKPSGGSWGTRQLVSSGSNQHSYYPEVVVDSTGKVHVAWFENSDDVHYNSKPSGGSWGDVEVVSNEVNGGSHPAIGVDSSNTVHVAWHETDDYGGSGSDKDIFYRYKSGGSWSSTQVISTESTDTSWEPSLAVDSDDIVHIVWTDATDYQGSGGEDCDIFYKNDNYVPNQPPTVEITNPDEGDTVYGVVTVTGVADDSDGDVTLVEVKIDDGDWDTASGTTSWSYPWDTTQYSYGEHTIYARSYDGQDYSEVDSVTVYVDNEQEDYPPNACYTWEDADGKGLGTVINFDASDSTDDKGIVSYDWDWTSDGTYDETGKIISHDYDDTDQHDCTLRVTDTIGQTNTTTITVWADVEGGENRPPVAPDRPDGPTFGQSWRILHLFYKYYRPR